MRDSRIGSFLQGWGDAIKHSAWGKTPIEICLIPTVEAIESEQAGVVGGGGSLLLFYSVQLQ